MTFVREPDGTERNPFFHEWVSASRRAVLIENISLKIKGLQHLLEMLEKGAKCSHCRYGTAFSDDSDSGGFCSHQSRRWPNDTLDLDIESYVRCEFFEEPYRCPRCGTAEKLIEEYDDTYPFCPVCKEV